MGYPNSTTDHINQTLNIDLVACAPVNTDNELKKNFMVSMQTVFVLAHRFLAYPYSLLGRIIKVQKKMALARMA